VRYSEVGGEGSKYEDVIPHGATVYTIRGLKLGTEYEFTVVAINRHGESEDKKEFIRAKTSAVAPLAEEGPAEDIPLIIILTVCGIGIILLALNIFLILFFIRRRRKKLDKDSSESGSQANTVEMFNAPPVFVDDTKSYTTYDQRSAEDVVDDYKYPYNPNEDLGPFFSTTEPFYPASYYFNYGQPAPSAETYRGYPNDGRDGNDTYNSGWRQQAPGTQYPPSFDQMDEDEYKEQLRRMQRSMSPGSIQQLSATAGSPRNYPHDDIARYAAVPDMTYPSSSLKKQPAALPPPPEMRGHLV
jgi:hypothetical protein